ncbi:hypothetical protein RUND412_006850 [Rhizina undulata]
MPLDENLPTFHLNPLIHAPNVTTLAYTANGSESQQVYTKTRDPKALSTYSATLHDFFVPDITYASVSCSPSIHTPATANEPQKILLPAEFRIDLFNPDSSVNIEFRHSTLRGNYWEFTLPKTSFLQPTSSKLDVISSQYQLSTMPRITFRWRKEGFMTRPQLRCSLVSPGNLPNNKKKQGAGEPDIPIAMFYGLGDRKGAGEIQIYQSNLKRVHVEDFKGLEVVLILSAMVIAEVWFGNPLAAFNIESGNVVGTSKPGRQGSGAPVLPPALTVSPPAPPPPQNQQQFSVPPTISPLSPGGVANNRGYSPPGAYPTPHQNPASFSRRYASPQKQNPGYGSYPSHHTPPASPTADELLALKLHQKEEQNRLRIEKERLTLERQYLEEAEVQRVKEMLKREAAEERRRKEAEVERETERLRKIYDAERRHVMAAAGNRQRRQSSFGLGTIGEGVQSVPARPMSMLVSTEPPKVKQRKSFMGLKFGGGESSSSAINGKTSSGNSGNANRRGSGGSGGNENTGRKKLLKKGSSMF